MKPLQALQVDEDTARANRALVHERAKAELLPFIQSLHRLGLIEGWRRVIQVSVAERKEESR